MPYVKRHRRFCRSSFPIALVPGQPGSVLVDLIRKLFLHLGSTQVSERILAFFFHALHFGRRAAHSHGSVRTRAYFTVADALIMPWVGVRLGRLRDSRGIDYGDFFFLRSWRVRVVRRNGIATTCAGTQAQGADEYRDKACHREIYRLIICP